MDEELRKKLEKPFDPKVIKQRLGPRGITLSYAPVSEYIHRLNTAFGAASWSFEIVRSECVDDHVVVEGKLTVRGAIKSGIGGAQVTCGDDGSVINLADDYKAAASDALKRCCRLLGIGLALYDDTSTQQDNRQGSGQSNRQRQSGRNNGRNDNRNNQAGSRKNGSGNAGRVTKAQMDKLEELVEELGLDWKNFRDQVRQRHDVNIEYADRSLASDLIGRLINQVRDQRSNGHDHDGNGADRGSW